MQQKFRKIELLQLLVLAAAVFLFHRWAVGLPNRIELGPRIAHLTFTPVALDPSGFGPYRLAGAWRVTSGDPRFGGVSALAVDGKDLLALTDSGVLVRFLAPLGRSETALITELPDGPGDPRFKSRRDSEALLKDPSGRGWWVAFENRNEIWLYDRSFSRALSHLEFGPGRWPHNRGIEALANEGGDLLLLPEDGDRVVRISGPAASTLAIANPAGRIADVHRLPSGQLLAVQRRWTLLGFSNAIAPLERGPRDYRLGTSVRLGLSPLDNVEALASERLADGRSRLWLMTDDNFQRPMRTLLVALDMPVRRPAD